MIAGNLIRAVEAAGRVRSAAAAEGGIPAQMHLFLFLCNVRLKVRATDTGRNEIALSMTVHMIDKQM